MKGITELDELLAHINPELGPQEFVFCTVKGGRYGDLAALKPVAMIREREGLTLVVVRESADFAGLEYATVLREIVLTVHSSLEAVGLTAAVSTALANQGIPANLCAGFFHDHLFVPSDRAEEALQILLALMPKA